MEYTEICPDCNELTALPHVCLLFGRANNPEISTSAYALDKKHGKTLVKLTNSMEQSPS